MPLLAASLFLSVLLQAPSDTTRAVHLLQRATWGARPADVAQVLALGRDRWLDRQLHPARIDDAALEQRLARFPALRMSVPELHRAFPPPAAARRQQQRADSSGVQTMQTLDTFVMQAIERPRRGKRGTGSPAVLAQQLVGARVERAVATERQEEDVMTAFWFNHFNVFWGKGPNKWLVADYERTAIRPHVFGRFEDLLRASAQHPAMLYYLDNWRSAAPDTSGPMARRARQSGRRVPGLNENYARELLELHTLGVNGGYTQADVVAVARAFTGWTIARRGGGKGGARMGHGQGPEFAFRPAMHDRGTKTVLGRTLPAEHGQRDGEEVLAMLARHPATARHIATKLVQRFVSDDPPPALVDHLARVFLRTDGDLREVTRALFTAAEFYAARHREAKVKTPFELVASALRVTDATVTNPRGLAQTLRAFGHLPYFQTAPTGYPTASEDWTNSGAMLSRMNFALRLASGQLPGVRAGLTTEVPVDTLIARVLPGAPRPRLTQVIQQDPATQQDGNRALGLVLGSPDFQRR